MSIAAKAFIGLILAVGVAALGRGLYLGGFDDPIRFFCYLVLAAAASCLKVRLPGVTGTMSVLFLFLLAGIIELTLIETLAIGIACSLVQCFWRAKVRPRTIQILFSFANISFATAAAEVAYHSSFLARFDVQPAFRLALAASVFFLCNTFPVATVIALTEGKSVRHVWSQCYCWSFPYYLIGAAFVGMFCFTNRHLDWQAWILILPVVYVIYRSYHQYLAQLDSERAQAEKQRRYADEIARLHGETEAALAGAMAANAKLDAVIQSSPLAIVGLDREGAVTIWNNAAQRTYGWEGKDLLGTRLPLYCGEGGEKLRAAVVRTLGGESTSGVEITHARKNGSVFEASVWTAPLRICSSVSGALVTVADISERKRLEEQLRTAEKMEAIGRLAGGIAHDFNNLLTIINGYGSMLVHDLAEDTYARSQAEEIALAGDRAAELVSQLLTFSRRQMLKPSPVRVNALIENVEKLLRRLIGEHIRFESALDENVGTIMVDPNQLETILMNLASNARDAMPDGGLLSIETAALQLTADAAENPAELPAGEYVRINVGDTGKGIDPLTQQHLFEPFYTTKERGKGTGLGLSSVYGGVQQNGGRITVSTEVGKGSTFSIYFPVLIGVAAADCEGAPIHTLAGGSETILLVEDEAALRRMLREALSKQGYRVWEAGNGADAIEHWADRVAEIDLLVTDIVMPALNGLRLAETLHERRPNLPVIYMSGHSDEVISRQAARSAALEFLPKPFLPEVLVCKVRSVLDEVPNRVQS